MKHHEKITREGGSIGAETDLHKEQNEMLAYLEDLDRVRDSTHIRDDLIAYTKDMDEEKQFGTISPGRKNIEMFDVNHEVKTITKGSKLLNAAQANRTAGNMSKGMGSNYSAAQSSRGKK
jgi:hypothetical protein